MYCEDSEATDIEHFYPKSTYPLNAFSWGNYLLACANCNSNYKRSQFPLDSEGGPLLINPMDEDPMEHLDLSLSTGKFVPVTKKGKESIRVFGLDRQVLETGRKDAWAIFCALALRYANLDRNTALEEAEGLLSALKNQSFSCVSLYVRAYHTSGNLSVIAPSEVIEALQNNPELLDISTH